MSSSLPIARTAVIAGVLALALSACGRRGAPEPPPVAAVGADAPVAEAAAPGTLPSPVGAPRGRPKQGYVIPNEPFILDPLL